MWQDDAVRTDEHILLDNHISFVFVPQGTPIEVSKNGGSKTDRAVVANRDSVWMKIVDVDKVGDPNIPDDFGPAHSMKPWPQATSSRAHESNNVKKPSIQVSNHW